ncbi:MAG: 3-dehydroquinate synthase [Defluviitaleaceae bacterium]|nr:3-dehydroquinate synthase [Defluviitaleaceae bacterium]
MIRYNWDDLTVGGKAIIITDEDAARLYLDQVEKTLNLQDLHRFILPAGEMAKNMENVIQILEYIYKAGFGRDATIIALGGGVVTDIGGFAASVYMRGIAHINLPTTLMGMVDAALGGKTGVDFFGGKNIIGTFHQPRLVYSNLATLQTLPEHDFISGLAEVIKYGIIEDRALLEYLHSNQSAVIERDLEVLSCIIRRCQNIKMDIVGKDEKEDGLRQILNFGHTFGHAIESALNFTLAHGHCVALGMVCALDYSVHNLALHPGDADFVVRLLKTFGLPTNLPAPITANDIYKLMQRDKKVRNDRLTLICTERLGSAKITINTEKEQIIKSIERILQNENC